MSARTVIAEAALPGGAVLRIVETTSDGLNLTADVNGDTVGALVIDLNGTTATLRDVTVDRDHRGEGIGGTLLQCATDLLAARGAHIIEAHCPAELGTWLRRHGFTREGEAWRTAVPTLVEAPTAEAMRALGEKLAALLAPGDVIIATGDLGAGKTTLTQGIGAGLGVAGPVISPTFVLSRVHPSIAGGPALVHVDAYRLGSFDELEDLDLEASLADSVTLVEWGGGIAEGLADDRLEIDIRRGLDPTDETRLVFLSGLGPRWAAGQLEELR